MLVKVLISMAVSAAIFFVIAFGLILSQPVRTLVPKAGLDFEGVMAAGLFSQPSEENGFLRKTAQMRDGTNLDVTHVLARGLAQTAPLIVMIHGSGWHGGQFDRLAWSLRDVAEVKAVTLRGHGANPERRGDIDYLGQYEDDLADLIGAEPSRPVILLGHSSGGGLVIRFAGGKHRDLMDRAILLAPYLHHNAPTARPNSGGWASPLLRRLIGLGMLNSVGIHWLDHLTVIQFNMAREALEGPQGHMATLAYTLRLNASYAPRGDYLGDVAQLAPFLLIAGAEDEAFDAALYEPTLNAATDKGQYTLLDGVGHLDVVDAPQTEAAIRELLRDL